MTNSDTYAIGIEHKPNEFGMTHGPTPNLAEMLKVYAADDRAVIFKFDSVGRDSIIYRWQDDGWVHVDD